LVFGKSEIFLILGLDTISVNQNSFAHRVNLPRERSHHVVVAMAPCGGAGRIASARPTDWLE
jgi:hypothetical protein